MSLCSNGSGHILLASPDRRLCSLSSSQMGLLQERGMLDLAEVKDKMTNTSTKTKKSLTGEDTAPQSKAETGDRNSKGRFEKGTSGNPGGRPKLPITMNEYGKEAPERLRAIADDPKCPIKVRADIEKWFAEMVYGKPKQQVDMEASVEQTLTTIRFEGELEEWAK